MGQPISYFKGKRGEKIKTVYVIEHIRSNEFLIQSFRGSGDSAFKVL
jgi:hypothetical protein